MMRMPVLIPEDPRPGFSAVVLNRATCVVGARSRVHLPLAAKEVSKAHALIVNDRDGVYIRDLASRNHTFVNDSPVRETLLEESDVLRIGRFAFRCQAGFKKNASPSMAQPAPAALDVEGMGQVPIVERTVVIGSRSDCDIVLSGDDVSPAHAVIFERNGERFLRDLDSSAGTLHNGAAVREHPLIADDLIQIGNARIHYRHTESPAEDDLLTHAIGGQPDLIAEPEDAALKVWDAGFNDTGHDTAIVEPSLPAASIEVEGANGDEPLTQPLDLLPPYDPPIIREPEGEAVYVMDEVPGEVAAEDLAVAASGEFDTSIPLAPIEALPIAGTAQDVAAAASDAEQTPETTESSVSVAAERSLDDSHVTRMEHDAIEEAGDVALADAGKGPNPTDGDDLSVTMNEHVTTGTISRLVGEMSEKAHELESAWREYETAGSRD